MKKKNIERRCKEIDGENPRLIDVYFWLIKNYENFDSKVTVDDIAFKCAKKFNCENKFHSKNRSLFYWAGVALEWINQKGE